MSAYSLSYSRDRNDTRTSPHQSFYNPQTHSTALSSEASPSPYISYFAKVYAKRMRYVVNASLLIAFPCAALMFMKWTTWYYTIAIAIAVRGPALAIALVIARLVHLRLATVNLSPAKSPAAQLYYTLSSSALRDSLIYFGILALVWGATYSSQLLLYANAIKIPVEYGAMRSLNDDFTYYWFHLIFIASVYAFLFAYFQRNRVYISSLGAHSPPDQNLFKGIHIIALSSTILAVIVNVLAPLAFIVCRPAIYTVLIPAFWISDLDTSMPSLGLSWRTYTSVSYASIYLVFAWELVHRLFMVYATIGCLDGNKPISSASPDPVHTLITGLKDQKPLIPLARATAFQELAYIASSPSPEAAKQRAAIFATQTREGTAWDAIMRECFLVIRETTTRINYRTAADLEALPRPTVNSAMPNNSGFAFGNSYATPREKEARALPGVGTYNSRPRQLLTGIWRWLSLAHRLILSPLIKLVMPASPVPSPSRQRASNLAFVVKVREIYRNIFAAFLDLPMGSCFRSFPSRDAMVRVPAPSIFKCAILACSHLLIHSINEDKLQVVTDLHIRDVLQVLEVLVRACKNYSESLPALVYSPGSKASSSHIIAKLHRQCLDQFFTVCVKFNYKLNDLLLNHRTQKLAKELMEAVITKQQQQHHLRPASSWL